MPSPISSPAPPVETPLPAPGAAPFSPADAWRLLWQGWPRRTALFLYYVAILIALLVIYGHGDFAMPTFIYQGF